VIALGSARVDANIAWSLMAACGDVRVRIERSDGVIEAIRTVVVEQRTHAHTALRRMPKRLKEQVASLITLPDETATGRMRLIATVCPPAQRLP
jgi:hypothetical protein